MLWDESGQATAEYALVIVAAAIVAVALITWASGSDVLPRFFEAVVERVRSMVGAGG
jgi:Flp pilus assembly pilin Flp